MNHPPIPKLNLNPPPFAHWSRAHNQAIPTESTRIASLPSHHPTPPLDSMALRLVLFLLSLATLAYSQCGFGFLSDVNGVPPPPIPFPLSFIQCWVEETIAGPN